MRTMRACTLHKARLTVTEIQAPTPGPGEMLLRVERAGICGTDLHLVQGGESRAAILGHEFAGTIVETGAGIERFSTGQIVCSMPTKGCGRCGACLAGDPMHCVVLEAIGMAMPQNGAFAEYVLVGQHETFVLPPGVDAALGSLVEPLAVGLKQAEEARCQPGDAMLILGAGPVGLATVIWARAMGVGDILVSDPVASRRRLALELGATAVVDPSVEEVSAFCQRELGGAPKVVVECIGRPGSFDMAMNLVAMRGRVVIGGMHTHPETTQRFLPFVKEVELRYCRMYEKRHFAHTLNMLRQGRISPRAMITHEVTLDELPATIAALSSPNEFGKVLVTPGRQVIH